jgi:hypothetical protein
MVWNNVSGIWYGCVAMGGGAFISQVEVSAEDSGVFMFRWVAGEGRNKPNVGCGRAVLPASPTDLTGVLRACGSSHDAHISISRLTCRVFSGPGNTKPPPLPLQPIL